MYIILYDLKIMRKLIQIQCFFLLLGSDASGKESYRAKKNLKKNVHRKMIYMFFFYFLYMLNAKKKLFPHANSR